MKFTSFLITICVASQAHATSLLQQKAVPSADQLAQVGALAQDKHEYQSNKLEPVSDKLNADYNPEAKVGPSHGAGDLTLGIFGSPFKYAEKDYHVVYAGYEGVREVCSDPQYSELEADHSALWQNYCDQLETLPDYLKEDNFTLLEKEAKTADKASNMMKEQLEKLKELRRTLKSIIDVMRADQWKQEYARQAEETARQAEKDKQITARHQTLSAYNLQVENQVDCILNNKDFGGWGADLSQQEAEALTAEYSKLQKAWKKAENQKFTAEQSLAYQEELKEQYFKDPKFKACEGDSFDAILREVKGSGQQ